MIKRNYENEKRTATSDCSTILDRKTCCKKFKNDFNNPCLVSYLGNNTYNLNNNQKIICNDKNSIMIDSDNNQYQDITMGCDNIIDPQTINSNEIIERGSNCESSSDITYPNCYGWNNFYDTAGEVPIGINPSLVTTACVARVNTNQCWPLIRNRKADILISGQDDDGTITTSKKIVGLKLDTFNTEKHYPPLSPEISDDDKLQELYCHFAPEISTYNMVNCHPPSASYKQRKMYNDLKNKANKTDEDLFDIANFKIISNGKKLRMNRYSSLEDGRLNYYCTSGNDNEQNQRNDCLGKYSGSANYKNTGSGHFDIDESPTDEEINSYNSACLLAQNSDMFDDDTFCINANATKLKSSDNFDKIQWAIYKSDGTVDTEKNTIQLDSGSGIVGNSDSLADAAEKSKFILLTKPGKKDDINNNGINNKHACDVLPQWMRIRYPGVCKIYNINRYGMNINRDRHSTGPTPRELYYDNLNISPPPEPSDLPENFKMIKIGDTVELLIDPIIIDGKSYSKGIIVANGESNRPLNDNTYNYKVRFTKDDYREVNILDLKLSDTPLQPFGTKFCNLETVQNNGCQYLKPKNKENDPDYDTTNFLLNKGYKTYNIEGASKTNSESSLWTLIDDCTNEQSGQHYNKCLSFLLPNTYSSGDTIDFANFDVDEPLQMFPYWLTGGEDNTSKDFYWSAEPDAQYNTFVFSKDPNKNIFLDVKKSKDFKIGQQNICKYLSTFNNNCVLHKNKQVATSGDYTEFTLPEGTNEITLNDYMLQQADNGIDLAISIPNTLFESDGTITENNFYKKKINSINITILRKTNGATHQDRGNLDEVNNLNVNQNYHTIAFNKKSTPCNFDNEEDNCCTILENNFDPLCKAISNKQLKGDDTTTKRIQITTENNLSIFDILNESNYIGLELSNSNAINKYDKITTDQNVYALKLLQSTGKFESQSGSKFVIQIREDKQIPTTIPAYKRQKVNFKKVYGDKYKNSGKSIKKLANQENPNILTKTNYTIRQGLELMQSDKANGWKVIEWEDNSNQTLRANNEDVCQDDIKAQVYDVDCVRDNIYLSKLTCDDPGITCETLEGSNLLTFANGIIKPIPLPGSSKSKNKTKTIIIIISLIVFALFIGLLYYFIY